MKLAYEISLIGFILGALIIITSYATSNSMPFNNLTMWLVGVVIALISLIIAAITKISS